MPIPLSSAAPRAAYQKLPGRVPSLWLIRRTLLLGEDCLMQTRMGLYREYYNRYDYKDIHALLLRRTPRGLVYNVILGVLATACGLSAYATNPIVGLQVFFGTVGAIWLILMLVNTARGATCRCQIQTALGPKVLPSLSRMRSARKAVRLIAERVEAVQGALTPEAADAQMEDFIQRKTREEKQPQQPAAAAGAVAPRSV